MKTVNYTKLDFVTKFLALDCFSNPFLSNLNMLGLCVLPMHWYLLQCFTLSYKIKAFQLKEVQLFKNAPQDVVFFPFHRAS